MQMLYHSIISHFSWYHFYRVKKFQRNIFSFLQPKKPLFSVGQWRLWIIYSIKNLWWIIKSIYIFYYWPTPTYTVDKSFSYYSFQENLPLATNPQLLVTSHQSRITQPTTKRHSSALFDAYLEKLWNLAPAHFTVHVGCPAKLRATVCRPRESRIAHALWRCYAYLFVCPPSGQSGGGTGNKEPEYSPSPFPSPRFFLHGFYIKKRRQRRKVPAPEGSIFPFPVKRIGRDVCFYTVFVKSFSSCLGYSGFSTVPLTVVSYRPLWGRIQEGAPFAGFLPVLNQP